MKILVSACLIGINCRYDGGNNRNDKVIALMQENEIVPVCPECLGKLRALRTPAELVESSSRERAFLHNFSQKMISAQ